MKKQRIKENYYKVVLLYRKYLFLILSIIVNNCFAQEGSIGTGKRYDTFPSPTAASLGQYGQTPVDLFSGQQQISIPIHEIKTKGISVPIGLFYNSGGNKVNNQPGWVGQGFDLQTGGVITRKANGAKDECIGGTLSWPEDNGGLTTYPFKSIDGGYLAGFADQQDEFSFNANGLSGSFVIEPNGLGKVKSKQKLDVKVYAEITSQGSPSSFTYAPIALLKFVLTDGNGTEYTFGGVESAIERSSSEEMSNWMIQNGYYDAYYKGVSINTPAGFANKAYPVSWYLTKIETLSGEKIIFEYVKKGTVVSAFRATYDSSGPGAHHPLPPMDKVAYSYTDPSYVSSITTSTEKVVINITPSGYLCLDKDKYGQAIDNPLYKLDKIDVVNLENNEVTKSINFNYIPNKTERLKLQGVSFNSQGEFGGEYKFTYNPLTLPGYLSESVDHWGYYNGKSPANILEIANFFNSKEPDLRYLQAEVLTSVQYPTGGLTKFFYEPKFYSNVATQYPFATYAKNGYADGLRIKKIIDCPLYGPEITKEYFYVSTGFDSTGVSSGVLSGMPLYHFPNANGKEMYQNTMVNSPSTTFGKHVTYSRVLEKSITGYKVYNYSNLDNGFPDKPAIGEENRNTNGTLYFYSSRELSRGNLLKEEYYSSDAIPKLVYQKESTYNEDLTKNIIATARGPAYGLSWPYSTVPSISFYYYNYVPTVSSSTETYFKNNEARSSTFFSTYNTSNNISEIKKTNSEGRSVSTKFLYPSDMIAQGRDAENIYADMVHKNIISPVIEKTEYVNNNQTSLIRTNYGRFNSNNLLLPKSMQEQIGSSVIETKQMFNKYDYYGGLMERQYPRGGTDAYVWGYNHKYLIAEIKNAEKKQIACANFEEYLDGDDQDNNTNLLFSTHSSNPYSSDAKTGKRSLKFGPSDRGETLNVLPPGIYTVSYWSKGGMMNIEELLNQKESVPDKNGWVYREGTLNIPNNPRYFYLYPDQSETTILIDDLRIYPVKAQMTTYTYDSFGGLTSKTDEKGNITYFEYDGFQRLKNIKDQNGNIVKNNTYHYKP